MGYEDHFPPPYSTNRFGRVGRHGYGLANAVNTFVAERRQHYVKPVQQEQNAHYKRFVYGYGVPILCFAGPWSLSNNVTLYRMVRDTTAGDATCCEPELPDDAW